MLDFGSSAGEVGALVVVTQGQEEAVDDDADDIDDICRECSGGGLGALGTVTVAGCAAADDDRLFPSANSHRAARYSGRGSSGTISCPGARL